MPVVSTTAKLPSKPSFRRVKVELIDEICHSLAHTPAKLVLVLAHDPPVVHAFVTAASLASPYVLENSDCWVDSLPATYHSVYLPHHN